MGLRLIMASIKARPRPLPPSETTRYLRVGKVGVFVETVALEDGHDSPILHLPVLHDGIENELSDFGNLTQVGNTPRLQSLGHGEYGPRVQPARYVVARGMIVKRFVGNDIDIIL